MDTVTAVFGKAVEYTSRKIVRQGGCRFHYKRNLITLETRVEELKDARRRVEEVIAQAKTEGRKIYPNVKLWITEVAEIILEAEELLQDEQAKVKCHAGFNPNPSNRRKLSRKSTKMLEVVAELYEKRQFPTISFTNRAQDVLLMTFGDYENFYSRSSTLKRIVDALTYPFTIKVGVYGIGGVGKTTLAEEVYRQVVKSDLFDEVIMVRDVESKQEQFIQIQNEIAEQLGITFNDNHTPAGRARIIWDILKERQTLIVFDDVQNFIDLKALGLPNMATCKVLLTSTCRQVLAAEMGTDREFQLDVLCEHESWNLFERMAGDVVKDPDIRTVAHEVAEACGGLPLRIVTVATSLRGSTIAEWRDALGGFKKFENKGDASAKASLGKERSFDQLEDEELKTLILLCGDIASSAWGCSISLNHLFKYVLGLGLLRNTDTVAETRDALLSLIEKLKGFCLLEDDKDKGYVRMPDRVSAKHITSLDQQILSVADGYWLKRWPDRKSLGRYSRIFLRSNYIPALPQVLECEELEMFFCCWNSGSSLKIPTNFFKKTSKLKVLAIENLHTLSTLPSLRFLKSLKTLCLDKCVVGDIAQIGELSNLEVLSFVNSNITQLPKEIGQLTRLKLLDLTDCFYLKVIALYVISRLRRLEDLRMRNVFLEWESYNESGESNACLSELKGLPLTALEVEIPDPDILPRNMFSHSLRRFQIWIGREWRSFRAMEETIMNTPRSFRAMEETIMNTPRSFRAMEETIMNTLKLKCSDGNYEWDEGLKLLVRRCEDLHLDGLSLNKVLSHLDGESSIKHLHIRHNEEMPYIISTQVAFPHLSTLVVDGYYGLRFMFSPSVARLLIQLKHLEIRECQIMEEIISAEQYGEENYDDLFPQLQDLKLNGLPNLAKFCSGACIEFPSLEILQIDECAKLETIITCPLTKFNAIDNEIDEKCEDPRTVLKYFIVDEKVGLPKLKDLSIDGSPATLWHYKFAPYSSCTNGDVIIPERSGLVRMFVPRIRKTMEALEKLICITSLIVYRCQGLSFLLPFHIARFLVNLRQLDISDCESMEEIVLSKEDDKENRDGMFSKLKELKLHNLPYLTRFCSESNFEFLALEILQLEKCTKFDSFILNHLSKSRTVYNEIEDRGTNVSLETVAPHFLFDKKVGFPKLKTVIISDLHNITTIWGSQLSTDSFSELKDITVQQCNSLKSILTDSIAARVYGSLKKLTVENCGAVEEIVAQEEIKSMLNQFVFPELICLEFKSLPQLKSYPRIKWSLLKKLVLLDCPKVDIRDADAGFSRFQKTDVWGSSEKQLNILVEKTSLPELEDLTLGPMNIWYGPPAPAALHNQAVFTGITTIPHLKTLRLHGMEKLTRLLEENLEPGVRVLTLLDTLEVKFCGLSNLELSAISFQNLTSLEVTFCWRLQYLTTYLVAKNLVQLERLIVDECIMMKEIVASDGDANDASSDYEILFGKLHHLELGVLTSLERFCSRRYIVKVPSLETLKVDWCPLELRISSDGLLEEVFSNIQESNLHREQAMDTTVSACSSEAPRDTTERDKPSLLPGSFESNQGIEAVFPHESPIESQKIDHTEVVDLNQKQIVVTNNFEDIQEANLGMQETLTEHGNLSVNKGKQLQLETDSWSLSRIDAEIRRLQELRTKEAERIAKEGS